MSVTDRAKLDIFAAVCREDRDNANLPRNQRLIALRMSAAAQRAARFAHVSI